MDKHPIIIDTDPGIDDFFAMILAASAENLEIRGVTAVAGNQVMEKIAGNARGIAQFLGWEVPVCIGADRPLLIPQITAAQVHGDTGLGHFPLPEPQRDFDARYAWDFIHEEAVAAGGSLEVIAIGPLTNLAIALWKYPDLSGLIRRLVIMGGSTQWGNRGAYGEFNFYVDPHAAQVVFSSGIPIEMVGLNVTMQTGLSDAEFDELAQLGGPNRKAYADLLAFYRNIYRVNDLGFQIVAMHDSLAVAYAMDPQVLEMRDGFVQIDCSTGPCRGRSVVDWEHEKPNARVAVAVDNTRFWQMIKRSLEYDPSATSGGK